jgi:TATA-box binding protein (TBP) (component of TFIID and TFIIIB)
MHCIFPQQLIKVYDVIWHSGKSLVSKAIIMEDKLKALLTIFQELHQIKAEMRSGK